MLMDNNRPRRQGVPSYFSIKLDAIAKGYDKSADQVPHDQVSSEELALLRADNELFGDPLTDQETRRLIEVLVSGPTATENVPQGMSEMITLNDRLVNVHGVLPENVMKYIHNAIIELATQAASRKEEHHE